jgi:glycosyltransferase involved in cell wall biosynthesis
VSGPVRVLLVESNEDGTAGGSHQCLYDIARSLDPAQFTPVVLFYQDNRFVERLRASGIRTLIWEQERARERPVVGRMRRARQVLALLGAIGRRVRLLRSERIGLLHMNDAPAIGFHDWLPAAKLLGIPALAHARGRSEVPQRAIWQWLVRWFDAVVPISREMERLMVSMGIPSDRMVQIYDGVDTAAVRAACNRTVEEVRRGLGVGPDQVLVAMVGHLRPWKGQDVVLEAARRLSGPTRERLRIVFVGGAGRENEPYAARLRETSATAGLGSLVSFLGEREDAIAIMGASDIVLHASTVPEPFGLVVVEGMALGRAVIAAAIGGPAEIVTSESGVLFDPTRPDALAVALESLASDPERRRRLGGAGRQRAEDFSLQHNVVSLQALYGSLLAGRPVQSTAPAARPATHTGAPHSPVEVNA